MLYSLVESVNITYIVVLLLLLNLIVGGAFAQQKKKPASGKNQKPAGKEEYIPQVNEISSKDSDLLVNLLGSDEKAFAKVMRDPGRFKLQIIYTQINRNKKNLPILEHHTFNLDSSEYFYPASMVKVPTALMALEKINTLKIDSLTKYSRMKVSAGYDCQSGTQPGEASREHGHASIAHYIKDVFVVSGNVAYDRLYEFCGQEYLNEELRKKGYTSCQITQRYGHYCTFSENRFTNPVTFYNKKGKEIYKQPLVENKKVYKKNLKNVYMGKSKKLSDGTVRDEPWDFTQSNFMSLKDMHEILLAIIMPMTIPKSKRFELTKDDYKMLHRYMSMTPPESKDPVYDSWYNYGRMKYILYGNERYSIDTNIRIFNKVGQALGFLTDCAYIVDFNNKVEFFISATIYVNENNVMGDGTYEYQNVGMPFLKQLGQTLLDFERERTKKYPPNLDFFKHDYKGY